MQAEINASLSHAKTLEARLRAIISQKFAYFEPNRKLLSAIDGALRPGSSSFSVLKGYVSDS